MIRGAVIILAIATSAAPALAQAATSVAIPEPGAIALFVIGVAGLVIGRRASRRGPRDDA